MIGGAYGYNQFSPFSNDIDRSSEHFGSVVTRQINLFGMLGVNAKLNLVASLPITRWSQTADQEDAHHRTETISGFQDLTMGVRFIMSNSYFGPGERIFAGIDLTIPTAASYKINPFSDVADSTDHRHFVFGAGTMRVSLTGEYWHRSEFPWVIGLTSLFSPRWFSSDIGFQPGHHLGIDLHAIGQSYRLWRSFPYLLLRIRWDGTDYWEGIPAPNSGGFFVEGSAGLDIEFTEMISGVLRFHIPFWVDVNGAQQTSAGVDFTLRFIKP